MSPEAVGSLATPLLVVRCQPNVTCAHMGASVWLLLPRPDRFSSPRGVFALRVDVFVLAVRNVSAHPSRWCCRSHFSLRACVHFLLRVIDVAVVIVVVVLLLRSHGGASR